MNTEPLDEHGGLLIPLPKHTAGERIAERLVAAIALGEFQPGERLPTERELAAQLRVSRASVREARLRLETAGYVECRRGRYGGTFVAAGWGPDAESMIRRAMPARTELEQLLDYRQLIEQQIARTAALRRDDEDIAAINAALDSYRRARDHEESHSADNALHQAIARSCHNPHMLELSATLRREVSLGFEAEPFSQQVRHRALHQHPELAQAVFDQDADLASRLAAEHFSLTEELLRELRARVDIRSAAAAESAEDSGARSQNADSPGSAR